MNDLDVIAWLAPGEPLASADDLAPARHRLTAALAADQCSSSGATSVRRGAPRHGSRFPGGPLGWRLSLAGTATGAVAAGVVVALAVSSSAPSGPDRPPAAGRTSPSTAAILPVNLTAEQFLSRAAAALLRQRAVTPRPDQFIYTKVIQTATPQTGPRVLRRWTSVSGARRGLIEPQRAAGTGRWTPCTLAQATATGCASGAAFLPDLPTSEAGLLAYLPGTYLPGSVPGKRHNPNWTANVVGESAWSLETQVYLLPAQKAAVFRLMRHIKGLHLARHVVDPIGRAGIGIWWRWDGGKTMLIFDPASFAFLASVAWPSPGSFTHGEVRIVLARMAIVSTLPRPANQVTGGPYPMPSPSPLPSGGR